MRLRLLAAAALAALSLTATAEAKLFTVTWSGAPLGNSGSAIGKFNIDTSLYPDLGGIEDSHPIGIGFQVISVVVTGTAAGDGVFGADDFDFFLFSAYSPLDYTKELIGQRMTNGFTFGSFEAGYGGGSGDFNIFALPIDVETTLQAQNLIGNVGAAPPNGSFYFVLTPNGSDSLAVVSILPGVPEPASWAMLIAGFGLTGAAMRRRRHVVV